MAEKTNEELAFKAEVQQLLHILAHSLYTEREIFLRELLSNASDALHRIQFELLTNREVLDPDAELAIHIEFDEEARTLTVSDTGIGMTREELVENLGTIAHSGAMAFLKNLEEGQRPGDIIGQFGVGFYAVFMVADEVRVTSRSYQPEAEAWTWTSRGENSYTLAPADKATRGTTIEVQLQEDASEFASAWRLEQIVKRHSDYVSFPIYVRDKLANQRTALWRQAPSEVEEGAYADFYRQLTLDFEEPLLHIHLVTDAPVHIRSILYVPRSRERGLFRIQRDEGLRLYSRKVLIQERTKELLPEYLRFMEGVVDSDNLPLNISRETVQSNRTMRHLRKALTHRALKSLAELAEERPDDYRLFWEAFGPYLKEGLATDPLGRDDLLPLLRFYSSRSGDDLISLAEYADRMAPDQEAIYYILGEDLASAARSPHLDYFRAHDLEVLYLVDPLDGFMMQALRDFEEKPLQNVDDAALDLSEAVEDTAAEDDAAPEEAFEQLRQRFQEVLGGRVTEVRSSKVLQDSPCRLVSPGDSPDRDLQRVRRLLEQDYQVPPKILELNRRHALIENLTQLLEQDAADPRIDMSIEQLFANLLLLEGLHPNPADMVPRLQALLEAAITHSEV